MIRAFKIILAAWIAVYLESTVSNLMTFWGQAPSLTIMVIVLVGLKQGPSAAVWTGLWAGFLADCFHPAGFGLYSAAGSVIGYLAGMARERIYREQLFSQAALVAVLTVIHRTWLFFGREGGTLASYPWFILRVALGSAIITALGAALILPAIDRWIYTRGWSRNVPGL